MVGVVAALLSVIAVVGAMNLFWREIPSSSQPLVRFEVLEPEDGDFTHTPPMSPDLMR
jgi:hypothetical protein